MKFAMFDKKIYNFHGHWDDKNYICNFSLNKTIHMFQGTVSQGDKDA